MKTRENPQQIITNYIKEFNNLLCDLVDDLQTKSYDVGQREISNLCGRFERELWYFWARNYYKDEIFRFALMHPEEAQDEFQLRAFLDSLDTMDRVEETVWDIAELNDEECQKIDDYNEYKEEMEKEMNSDYYGDGAGVSCPACGLTEFNLDIRIQPVNKKRISLYKKKNYNKSLQTLVDVEKNNDRDDYDN